MYKFLHAGFRRLPPDFRTSAKRLLGSEGHGRSPLDWLTARKDAAGKKRLDIALAGLMKTLGPEGIRIIAGKSCIDFGAGYVPTDGIALWLLGAREVFGVDYNDLAKPAAAARAIRSADLRRVESQLGLQKVGHDWQERLAELEQWAASGGRGGWPTGYKYLAPLDVTSCASRLPAFDILISTSVLEHIPPSRIVSLMEAVASRANPGAKQFHRVDLRDHRDFERDPYGFLDPSGQFDAELEADSRGNGMTLGDWQVLLSAHPQWGLSVCEYEDGNRRLLPMGVEETTVVADSLVLRSIALSDV